MRKAKKILIIAGCALLAAAVILFCGGMSAAGKGEKGAKEPPAEKKSGQS